MNMGAFGSKGRDDGRNASFVAYIADEASVQEFTRIVELQGINDVSIARGDIDAAIQHLGRADKPPKKLVVDISGIAMPLLALGKLAEACDPSVHVYVLGDQNDVKLYRSLLQAGIQDYLVKPLTADALRPWLESDEEQAVRRLRTGKVISVLGTRGGVGATTIAANLARQLTSGKGLRRVVYLDMDLYGAASATLLGLPPNHALPEVLQNIDRIDPQFLERTLTNVDGRLYVLGANLNFPDGFVCEAGRMGVLLDVLSQHFHYVVVDLHKAGGRASNEVLSQSDMACVVSDYSVHSARTLTRLLVYVESRPASPAMYVVLNASRPPRRGRIEGKEFTQAISHPVSLEIGYDSKATSLAEDLGEPLAAQSDVTRGIAKLARLMTGDAAGEDSSVSLVGRFLRRTA